MTAALPLIISVMNILYTLLGYYQLAVIAAVIFSWLRAFRIINTSNTFVAFIDTMLRALTEPFLRWIRRVLPPAGGIDFSPVILLFGIYFLQELLRNYGNYLISVAQNG